MPSRLPFSLVVLALAASPLFAAGEFYCCPDAASGRSICGDTLPEQCRGRAYRVIGNSGNVIKEVGPPLSAEQKAEQAAEARRKKQVDDAAREQRAERDQHGIAAPLVDLGLAELDGLRMGIQAERPGPVRDALDLVLSSLLTKLSLRRKHKRAALATPVAALGRRARWDEFWRRRGGAGPRKRSERRQTGCENNRPPHWLGRQLRRASRHAWCNCA